MRRIMRRKQDKSAQPREAKKSAVLRCVPAPSKPEFKETLLPERPLTFNEFCDWFENKYSVESKEIMVFFGTKENMLKQNYAIYLLGFNKRW